MEALSYRELREIVRIRDGDVCQYCWQWAPDGEADHVIPRSKGGPDSLDNMVWSCRGCNRSKGARLLAPDLLRQLRLGWWWNLAAWVEWRIQRWIERHIRDILRSFWR